MSEWESIELKELTTKIGSGATPRGGQEAYKSEGISLIRSQNILDFSFSYNGLAFIDEDQAFALRNVEVQENDILINITGDSVARVAKVPNEVLPARVNQHVSILRSNKGKLDPDYLLYYLLNPIIKKHLLRIASDGATRNALTKSDLEDLIIQAPKDVEDQREIAKTINVYDRKIKLLREQNQTLEELAQTLFKRWFIEFEFPNENGEPYKRSGGLMVESELGEIPEGWSVGIVKDLIQIPSGHAFKSKNFDSQGKYKLITIKNVQDGIVVTNKTECISNLPSNLKKHCVLKTGDILLSLTGNVGRVGIVCESDLLLNQRVGLLRPIKEVNRAYTYLLFRGNEMKYKLITNARGTAQANLSPVETENLEVVIPNEKVLLEFSSKCDPIYNKLIVNNEEIQSLTQLRDTLLPKLMSGELRVKE